MNEKIKVRFEAEPEPQIEDVKEIKANTEDFDEPEKAEAIIKCLKLCVGNTLKENDVYYTINPRMVLEGNTPNYFKETIENLKKILTKQEIKAISQAISRNTKDYNKNLYGRITKRTDKFYYRNEIKKSLSQEIKEILEFFKNNNHTGISNTIYHLLSKGKEDYIECFKCAWKNKPIPNIQKWREENGGEYMVLTDEEADEKADDYLDEDDWKLAVQNNNTTASYEDWREDVLNINGRGSILNPYDGCEEVETINGTDYYIYRTN